MFVRDLQEADRCYEQDIQITGIAEPWQLFANCIFENDTLLRTPPPIQQHPMNVPAFIKTIGGFAFCDNQSVIYMPSVTKISSNAFTGCNSIIYAPALEKIESEAFVGVGNNNNILLYAPNKNLDIAERAFLGCNVYIFGNLKRKKNATVVSPTLWEAMIKRYSTT